MHWLESQIQVLHELEQEYSSAKRSGLENNPSPRAEEREKRLVFIEKVQALVTSVSGYPGISGCLSCHDGLVIARAGSLADFDAAAATAQECIWAAGKARDTIGLGDLHQIVIVGSENKISVIIVGQVAICILSPSEITLSAVFSEQSPV